MPGISDRNEGAAFTDRSVFPGAVLYCQGFDLYRRADFRDVGSVFRSGRRRGIYGTAAGAADGVYVFYPSRNR